MFLTLQLSTLLKEYLSAESAPLGDTLETALEHGERYEEYVSDCKMVGHDHSSIVCL